MDSSLVLTELDSRLQREHDQFPLRIPPPTRMDTLLISQRRQKKYVLPWNPKHEQDWILPWNLNTTRNGFFEIPTQIGVDSPTRFLHKHEWILPPSLITSINYSLGTPTWI